MSDIDEKTYIALQMACELRQVITERFEQGAPDLDIPPGSYPLSPLEGESFDNACRRIFGDYVYNLVMYERMHPDEKYPKRFYKNWKPKGPGKQKPLNGTYTRQELQEEEMNTRRVIKNMPTIMTNSDGADLKIEESTIRVWIESDNHTITVEILNTDEGRWELLDEYP